MIKRASRHFAFALLAGTALSQVAYAQSVDLPAPPPRKSLDENGVDLSTGQFEVSDPVITIGGAQGLSFRRYAPAASGAVWSQQYRYAVYGAAGSPVVVYVDDRSLTFDFVGGAYVNKQGSGETLVNSAGSWTLTLRDGTLVQMDLSQLPAGRAGYRYGGSGNLSGLANTITFPDKHTLKFFYKSASYPMGLQTGAEARLRSVLSSNGYLLKLEYYGTGSVATTAWALLTKATLINQAVDYCDPSADACAALTQPWPTLTYDRQFVGTGSPYRESATDSAGRKTSYSIGVELQSVRRPGSSSDDITLGTYTDGRVFSLTRDGGTWSYAWSGTTLLTATVTNPDGSQRSYVTDASLGQLKSETNELGQTTSYTYDTNGRVTSVTYPEGNKVQYTYDSRGNVTEQRSISKTPGTPPDIVISAIYAATCTNALTCNKPTTATDARGNVTNFTYDPTHGGVVSVKSPAPATGAVRPETRYGYVTRQAYYKNSIGSIVASGQNTYVLSSISACQTLATCAGSADEVKTTIDYGPQVAGTANNLLPVSTSKGAGDNSLTATSAVTYDPIGNATYVDGPLAGTSDTRRILYDAVRQVVGQISPDPDGAGPLKMRAIRFTYRPDGQVSQTEIGTVASQSDSGWTNFSAAYRKIRQFDANSRISRETLSSGSTDYSVVDYLYDSSGRRTCSITHMDPAQWGPQASSCAPLQYNGPNGPDSVTEITYDSVGRPSKLELGVGSLANGAERSLAYTPNGELASIADGENNLTVYEYDGQDRLLKTRFPLPAKGSNAGSTTDYEEYGYDSASNVTTFRNRNNQTIVVSYDNLNRPIFKNLPGSEPDVTYAYDNLGRLISASQTGFAQSFTYDALGRNLTQVSPQGTTASAYDLAGRRTQLTWPDNGLFVNYDYLVTGETTKIRENGATSGVGVLATYAYDDLGRRTGLTFGNGVVQNFGYDPVSRPALVTNDLAGTTSDFSATFGYSPASQIASTTRTAESYAWTEHNSVARNYSANGLNQYSASGSITPTYDSKGNLTSAGSTTYTYSSENLLTSATGGITLAYDPMMRMRRVDASGAITNMVYDGLDRIVEYSNSVVQRRYVHGPGTDDPIVWYEGSGTTGRRFLSSDERGSIVSVTDSAGTLLGINRYDEYGIPQSTNIGVWGYSGQAWLPELGMQYSKARIYSPTLGRFLQPDPMGYDDNSNVYAYVHNDPINMIDPLGLCSFPTKTDANGTIVVTACRPHYFGMGGMLRGIGGFLGSVGREIRKALHPPAKPHKYKTNNEVCERELTEQEGADLLSRFAGPFGFDVGYRNGNGYYMVTWHSIPGGFVQTTFSPNGQSVTNVTTPVHAFVGQITRTVVRSGGATFISTYGSGNAGPGGLGNLRDGANELFGPVLFNELDDRASDYAKSHYDGC